jgi:hypothetical protein
MADEIITLEITVRKSDLTGLFKNHSTISCFGASGTGEPVQGIVDLVKAPRPHDIGESYVLCPRLREIYDGSIRLMCYEGEQVEQWNIYDKAMLEHMKPCPYLRIPKHR